jgi:hypothetical protein
MTATGWGWFAAWAFAGALSALAFVSLFSIGILIAPFAAVAIFLAARRSPDGPEILGIVTGAGLIGLVVWILSRGEWDATPWLVGGVALTASGVVAYAAVRGPPL